MKYAKNFFIISIVSFLVMYFTRDIGKGAQMIGVIGFPPEHVIILLLLSIISLFICILIIIISLISRVIKR